jgi:hypothetical protein
MDAAPDYAAAKAALASHLPAYVSYTAATHRPVIATGTENDPGVAVRLEQRFVAAGDYVLPSSLYVRVQGSGLMSWLEVLYDRRYEDYRFSTTEP